MSSFFDKNGIPKIAPSLRNEVGCRCLISDGLFLFHRVADLGHKLIRIVRFVRTDMVNVEHRVNAFISVGIHPLSNSSIDFRNQVIATFECAACHCDLRQCRKFDMLSVGIAPLDGLPCHHLHIFLLVLSVKESDGTKTRVCLGKIHMSGFGHQSAPYRLHIISVFAGYSCRLYRCAAADFIYSFFLRATPLCRSIDTKFSRLFHR